MNLPCALIQDLLPLYREEMVGKETKALVEAHLSECPDCQKALAALQSDHHPSPEPMETNRPLQSLKNQLRKRRWQAAAMAALLVFVVLFSVLHATNRMAYLPWTDGMIQIKGVEKRDLADHREHHASTAPEDPMPAQEQVDVLVIRMDSRIAGVESDYTEDEDGSTLLIQGAARQSLTPHTAPTYSEMVFCPVPDRVIYGFSSPQVQLWGTPMNGGIEVLPRLALGYYVLAAGVLAAITGVLWLFFRKRKAERILRQVCFAPLSYLLAHLLLKGTATTSFFMETELISILLLAAALYGLLTLVWIGWMRRRTEA